MMHGSLIQLQVREPRSYGTVFSNYGDNPSSDYGQNIRRLINNEGYTGEHAFSIGGNYSNKVFFGATIGISRLNIQVIMSISKRLIITLIPD